MLSNEGIEAEDYVEEEVAPEKQMTMDEAKSKFLEMQRSGLLK